MQVNNLQTLQVAVAVHHSYPLWLGWNDVSVYQSMAKICRRPFLAGEVSDRNLSVQTIPVPAPNPVELRLLLVFPFAYGSNLSMSPVNRCRSFASSQQPPRLNLI